MRGSGRNALRAVWAPSLIRRVLRHRAAQAGVVIAVGVLAAVALSARATALEDERSSWGETQRVFVVTERVSVGDEVGGSGTQRDLPAALLPDGVVVDLPAGARAKVALYPGEVLLSDRITGTNRRDLPPGTVALTLPVVAQVPLVEVGDLVDLWSVDSANHSSERVAAQVVVLALSDRDITVAVPDDQVAAAAVASLRPITVTLVG